MPFKAKIMVDRLWDCLTHNLRDPKRLILISLILIIILASFIRLYPYLSNDYYFEVGFDTGTYERFTDYYLSGRKWNDDLPAYPFIPSHTSRLINWMEPGFPTLIGMLGSSIDGDVRDIFRYFLPVLISLLFVVVLFSITTKITASLLAGVIVTFLFATSNIQYESVNESYYKQLFATFLLLVSIMGLDSLRNERNGFMIIPTAIVGGSIYSFHRAIAYIYVLLIFYAIIRNLIGKEKDLTRKYSILLLFSLIISLPALLPRIGMEIDLLMTFFSESISRASSLVNLSGTWSSGGSIPYVLWGYDHILIGYVFVFMPIAILAAIGALVVYKWKFRTLLLPLGGLLILHIGLWLYFGNRLISNLDLLAIVFAGIGLATLLSKVSKVRPFGRIIGTFALISLLLLSSMSAITFQEAKKPYIVENLDGVRWIEENIDPNDSVIFAPDYLSADLVQLGYRMAIWDYSLTSENEHPIRVAEQFMLEAPGNRSYVNEFLKLHIEYSEFTLFVLWGEWDLDRPLVSSKALIPVDEYRHCDWFKLVYEGFDEILEIYELDLNNDS